MAAPSSGRAAAPALHPGDDTAAPPQARRTCACSPTTHPGSFRCRLHRGTQRYGSGPRPATGAANGELVRRSLGALIRPSSHQIRRRAGFQPLPSRLSVVSTSEDGN